MEWVFLDRPPRPQPLGCQPCEDDHPLLQDKTNKSSTVPRSTAKERPAAGDRTAEKFVDPLSAFGLDPLSAPAPESLLDEAETTTDSKFLGLSSRYVVLKICTVLGTTLIEAES